MGKVWSIGIFEESKDFSLEKDGLKNLVHVFPGKTISKRKNHIHTIADPFFKIHQNVLYLFAEMQQVSEKGFISGWRSADGINWEELGPILKQPYHVSYPCICTDAEGKNMYLIPETCKENEVSVWKFTNFPFGLEKVNPILKGTYVDSNVILHNNTYYLFTTKQDGPLEIYYSKNIESDKWESHPSNPIEIGHTNVRNGGGPVMHNNKLYRIAQNGQKEHGTNLAIVEIMELNEQAYSEKLLIPDFKPAENHPFQSLGRHHLNLIQFKDKTIIAVDGLEKDYFINKFTNAFFKLF